MPVGASLREGVIGGLPHRFGAEDQVIAINSPLKKIAEEKT